MMDNKSALSEVITDSVQTNSKVQDPKELSLESLTLLLNTGRLNDLNDQSLTEFQQLKKRQDQVATMHRLLKAVNRHADKETGEIDWSQHKEMQQLLMDVNEFGVDHGIGKDHSFKLGRHEKETLQENLRMTIEDLNVHNDMQLQTITRLTNERYESYQMARACLKPLHDDKVNKARAIAGR